MSTRVVRRQKRRRVEEMMAWVLLPAVLIVGYVIGIAFLDRTGVAGPELVDFKAMQQTSQGIQRSVR